MRRLALVLVLAAALALAGCLGGGGDAADTSSTDEQLDEGMDPQRNATDNETDPGPDLEWNETIREGSFTGGNAGGLAVTFEGANENWTVRQGTRNLTLNLSTGSDEATMRIAPPGCENEAGSECTTSVSTEDGEAQWSTEDPDPGQWSVTFFRGENGYGEVEYELTIAKLVPAGTPASS